MPAEGSRRHARRDSSTYVLEAERRIDQACIRLSIFESPRASALLKLITVADDKMRIAGLASDSPGPLMQYMVKAQDSFRFAIPWIFERCTDASSIPTTFNEADWKQGSELLDCSYAYETAVLFFTLYHKGRFRAVVAKKDPRITFCYSSPDILELDRERYAYALQMQLERADSKIDAAVMTSLRRLVPKKFRQLDPNRLALDFDEELIEVSRAVGREALRLYPFAVPVTEKFVGVPYGDIRAFWGVIVALAHAHAYLHQHALELGMQGGASASLAQRYTTTEFQRLVTRISQLQSATVNSLVELFTFDKPIANLDPITRPLIAPNPVEIIIPFAYAIGSNIERNLLKLLAKHPSTTADYQKFSQRKEGIAILQIKTALEALGILLKTNVKITKAGHNVTDVDILAYDRRDGAVLVIQHKWLIEPSTAGETTASDEELGKAMRQAEAGKEHFSDFKRLREVLPDISADNYSALNGLVLSRGLEPTGFVKEGDIPIVTEEWFTQHLALCGGLRELHRLAMIRPDRTQLKKTYVPTTQSVRIAGFELVFPAFAKIQVI